MGAPMRRFLSVLATLTSVLAWSGVARAERELIVPFHEAGHLVLDQLSGLRIGASSGVSYSGPLGLSFQSSKADAFTAGQPGAEMKTTTFWFAPSADVFVTEHVSVGGLIEVTHAFGTVQRTTGETIELPATTGYTFLPRVGFFVPFGDRFGLWPRAGIGFSSAESVQFAAAGSAPVTDTFRSLVLDVDLALVYRFTESFFMRVGPEVGTTLGGRHTQDANGTSAAADASAIEISGVLGVGVNLEL